MFAATSALLALFAASLPYVSAHGVVKRVDVVRPDGSLRSSHNGNFPRAGGPPSIVRQLDNAEPTEDLNSPDMNCGPGAQPAALVAEVEVGDTLKFAWSSGDGINTEWPHNTGPVIDYITACGQVGCDEFNPINAQWFKLQEQGRRPNGQWVQADIFEKPGTLDLTIPDFMPAGEYLIRHEIIGLHILSQGVSEHYPSCIGIKILSTPRNEQAGKFDLATESVRFPGGYSRQDAGLNPAVTNAFDTNAHYVFPGPPLISVVSAPPAADAAPVPAPAIPVISNPAPAPVDGSEAVVCSPAIPKNNGVAQRDIAEWRDENNRPYVRSRIMRNLD